MRPTYYRLEGKTLIPCTGIEGFMSGQPHVGRTEINGILVSTVFLSLDHQYGDGPPLVFETMIFGGDHDGYQWRYSTWDEAAAGHAAACRMEFGDAA